MAALRANTMHNSTSNKSRKLIELPVSAKPKKKPIMAKGRANTVCANFTREKYLEIVEIMLILYQSIKQKYTLLFILFKQSLLYHTGTLET
jgi:hypothetical protein